MCIESADCETETGNHVGDGTNGGQQIILRGAQHIGTVLVTFNFHPQKEKWATKRIFPEYSE